MSEGPWANTVPQAESSPIEIAVLSVPVLKRINSSVGA
jgi:hypothetical protein